MIKNRFFSVFAAVLFLSFQLNSPTFAEENTGIRTEYPDYAYEFLGPDKYEKFNRKMFAFNLKANKYVVRPINIFWASIMPQYGMDRINNFYTNFNYPVRLMGALLQNDFEASRTETARFLINTTIGLAGLYDPALSKFKIEPRNENIEQALAYHNVKQGSFVVLPIVAQGSTRDIAGQILDLPLNPCSYIVGPVSLASTGLSLVNGTTYMQPIFKMAENYADPYEVAKQLNGIEKYIKNTNIDRRNFIKEAETSQNLVSVNDYAKNKSLKADINLYDYNPQGKETDALRTMLFDSQKLGHSAWSELSFWNKNFNKKIKTASINIEPNQPNYKYKYIMQKDKTAPVAILYPSIGEGITSNQSAVFTKILYDEGYSVIILGSSFNWAFVKSMPKGYYPGLPYQDAHYLRVATSMALNQLQEKYKCKFDKKVIVGTSFGGLTGLFVAAKEENDNTLGISDYIFVCPPIQIFYALQQIDKYSQNWKNVPTNIKESVALTSEKIIQVSYMNYANEPVVTLPFSEDESKLAISYAMRQKLYDLIFTIEDGSVSKKNDIYEQVSNMSFYDYAQKYLISTQDKPVEKLAYDSSLYSLSDFLKKNKNYKIYHALDDCFTTPEQLSWLKNQTGNKAVLFSNGSHLGFLYRQEFIDAFKNDVKRIKEVPKV